MLHIVLQADGATDAVVAAAQSSSISLLDLAVKGGWLMLVLLALSIMAVYIFGERLVALRRASKVDQDFMNNIKEYIHDGKIPAACHLCQDCDNVTSRLILTGLQSIGRPMSEIRASIENKANIEVANLEKSLPVLASISGGAPMIGFLGTVIGMVRAFYNMSMAGNNIDITLLSGGIYTAMVTTVGGLIVGITAYFMYNLLTSRIGRIVNQMESNTLEFLELLQEPLE